MSINLSLFAGMLNWPERPWVLLITIPALIIGIIPFLRLNKKRRASSRHLIPFIIHMALILILSLVVAGVSYTESYTESQGKVVMFLVDMSDSSAPTKDEMNDYMHEVMSAAKSADKKYKTETQFGLIVFGGPDGNGVIKSSDGKEVLAPGALDIDTENFLDDYVKGEDDAPRNNTNIKLAIEKAQSTLSAEMYKEYTKKVILLSDGKQTNGNSYSAAAALAGDSITLDCAYFDFVNNENEDITYKEIQVISLDTNGIVKLGEEVEAQVVINSIYHVTDATITLKDVAGVPLTSVSGVVIPKGQSTHIVKFTPRRYTVSDDDFETNNELKGQEAVSRTGVQAISVDVTTSSDTLKLNNVFSSWYTFETQGQILIVYGDSTQLEQIEANNILEDMRSKYNVDTCAPSAFPDTLEKMLVYDEIVLMNVDFTRLGSGSQMGVDAMTIANNIKRYVQENGRGLLFTSGDNIYDYDNEGFVDSPINDILPVELKVDEEKETVAMVLVIDLSSSMKEKMGSQTRFQIVLDSAKKVIMESKFAPEDYVGVVVFDQDYHVALEIQPIGDETNRETICETMEYEIEHYYYAHYIDSQTGKDSDYRINPNDKQIQKDGKTYLKIDGEEPRYYVPTHYDYKHGGQDKVTNDYIKSYGTSYKWAIQEASAMLGRASNITSLEIKQVIFMSDGAPNDRGSGYEGIVERMAKGGTVTSSIAIGISESDATAIAELEKISVAGKGELFLVNDAEQLTKDLTEIAESIQGKLLNTDVTVLPMRDSLNSIIHEGVREYDYIHGYYGTTIKEGAERLIYVDNLRPLYAEWECGLGKVCALMTDLGNPNWTGEMFDDTDGTENIRLVSNILLSPIYKRVDSTGLDYTVTRDDTRIDMTVITPVDLGTRKNEIDGVVYEEVIRASVYKFDQTKKIWVTYGTYHATPLANSKYQVTIPTGSLEETYVIVLELYKAQVGYNSAGSKQYSAIEYTTYGDDPLRDTTALAVVGKTLEEYDILRGDQNAGRDLMNGLVTSKLDGLINGNEYNLDEAFRKEEGDEKTITEEYNIDIPLIALALVLFVLDIIFRNFVIKKKTKKKGYKTDEEVYESMRGR